jgi:hypothetical protein
LSHASCRCPAERSPEDQQGSPLEVSSSTRVLGLNADLVDSRTAPHCKTRPCARRPSTVLPDLPGFERLKPGECSVPTTWR